MDGDGCVDNKETADAVKRGRMYAQALLDELELGGFDEWIKDVADSSDEVAMRAKINPVFVRLHKKARDSESWTNLPFDAVGGPIRRIAQTAPKLIGMAIHRAVDTARRDTTGERLNAGFIQTFGPFKDAESVLKKAYAEQAVASGVEAKQRREKELFDHEVIALYESILSNAVAEDQRRRDVKATACRHPTDTLTLGTIVALHRSLGQRCLNVSSRPPTNLTPASTRLQPLHDNLICAVW